MKKIYSIVIAILIITLSAKGQLPSYQWANKTSPSVSTENSGVTGVVADTAGNVYTTGWFTGTANFSGITKVSTGGSDFFIAKYNPSGVIVWVNTFGSSSIEIAYDIKIDAYSNIYVCGIDHGFSFDFDPSVAVYTPAPNTGFGFIAKYDNNGNFIWANDSGDEYVSLDIDKFGNVFVIGIASTTQLDIKKYASNGVYISGAVGFATSYISSGRIKVDTTGNVFVVFGYHNSGGATFGVVTFPSGSGSNQIGLIKYTNTLSPTWGTVIGGTGDDFPPFIGNLPVGTDIFPCDISIDNQQNVCLAASFRATVLSTVAVNSQGDGFFAKFNNSTGANLFFKQLRGSGGSGIIRPTAVKIDSNDNINIVGYFSGTIDCDPSAATAILNVGTSGLGLFWAKYDITGNYISNGLVGNISSSDKTIPHKIFLTSSSLYFCGEFFGTNDYDMSAGVANLVASSSSNGFVAKYNYCSVAPSQPVSISGTATICSGTTNTYSITAVAGATSYTWTLPSGWTGTSTTNSINATASVTSGNITVTANNTCGNSTAQTLSVVVNTTPATPGTISGTATICSGTTNTYSIAAVTGATSYTWTLPSGWTGTSTTNSINATANSTSGNITVTANNACGNSAAQTLAVVVNTIPTTPGTISGTATICSGTINTYSITAVAGATSYTWALPGGWTGTSTTNSINATASATSGNITVTANNTCGNSTAQTLAVTVNTIPSTPGTISGSATICSGTSNTYSITAVAGATSYTWTLPGGWTGTSTTNSINATASATSGNITVTANNTCGNSSATTLAITINTIPATPGTISGLASMCIGTGAQTYNITSVGGATSYTWTLPATWIGTSTTNSIVATPGTSGGNITVTANNTCGNSSPQTLAVTVNPLPVVTYSQSPALVCINTTSVALGTVSPTGGTFTGTAVTGSTFNASTAGTGTFNITYTYTDGNGCVNSAISSIVVDPCTGISQNAIGNEIVIYPNPTTAVITFSGVEGAATIEVYNVLGKIILSQHITNDKTEIDLSRETNGIYIIKIITDRGTITKRIVKQ